MAEQAQYLACGDVEADIADSLHRTIAVAHMIVGQLRGESRWRRRPE
jgi:hypothetical protein